MVDVVAPRTIDSLRCGGEECCTITHVAAVVQTRSVYNTGLRPLLPELMIDHIAGVSIWRLRKGRQPT